MKRLFILMICVIPVAVLLFSLLQLNWTQHNLSVELERQPKALLINGETSLPEGAYLIYEISTKVTDDIVATGVMRVSDGRYSEEVDHVFFPQELLKVIVRFEIRSDGIPQLPSVVARFGREGERISGEQAKKEGNRKWLEVRKEIDYSK